MSDPQTWTVGKLLEWTTGFLKEHGSDSPRLDAEVLLAHARNCQRINLYTSFHDEPSPEERAKYKALVLRRKEGEPVAYLVGHQEFYSLDFEINSAVLIPRSETEYAVVAVIDHLKSNPAHPWRVADVCTGSGCIAIAIAKHAPASHITAIDLSPDALAVAKQNVTKHELDTRIDLVQSDLFADIPQQPPFDVIVSNPPYVSESEYQQLPISVRNFEPKLALVADQEGMAIIDRMGDQATSHLAPNGLWIFEISPMLANPVLAWFQSHPAWKFERFIKDLAGHSRIVVAKLLPKE